MEKKRSLVNFAGLLLSLVLVAMSQTAHGVERISYYHNDHLGSPVVATNPQGNVVWRESYQPYGTREHQGGNQNSLWFTGKQEEASFGVSYFGARWYAPEIGRFLAMDPVGVSVGNPHSFNRYAYANNNPYLYIDPTGRFNILFGGGVSAAAPTGGELSGGIVVNPGLYNQEPDAGVFGSAGVTFGLNVSADIFMGAVAGGIENVSGKTINQNIGVSLISLSLFRNPETGKVIGGTIGFGPGATPAGYSDAVDYTGTYTLRDVAKQVGEWFSSQLPFPQEPAKSATE